MKILYFLAGVITGVIGIELYGIFVQPVMPRDPQWIDDNGDQWNVYTFGIKFDPDDTKPVKVR